MLLDELIEEAKKKVFTERMITTIYEDLATIWKSLAPHLGISQTRCDIIDENERKVEEKGVRLVIVWMQTNGHQATVGRLVDALENIGKTAIVRKLLAEVGF